ncbi:hypothetical protein THAOC_04446, partial [Thalassiosira oceanica]
VGRVGGGLGRGHVAESGPVYAGNAVSDGPGGPGRGPTLEVGSSEEEDSDGDDGGPRGHSGAPDSPIRRCGVRGPGDPGGCSDEDDDGVDWEDRYSATEGAGPPAHGNGIAAANSVLPSDPARATEEADDFTIEEKAATRGDVRGARKPPWRPAPTGRPPPSRPVISGCVYVVHGTHHSGRRF